jgi:uncharacterized protein (DUF1800 family)
VVHLHRRAGFATNWRTIQRALAAGPAVAVSQLLESRNQPTDPFEERAKLIADGAVAANDIARLQAWWIYRMTYSPDPLGERLCLMWHSHFATSFAKVKNVDWLRQQNETLRKLARAPFGALLRAMLKDPALLTYLDAPLSRKEKPNENLGRELLELFTLSRTHYAEQDVRQASRALTGWSVGPDGFRYRRDQHDEGQKLILGQRGNWDADDLARILIDQPALAQRLAWRICQTFMGEGIVSQAALDELAAGMRSRDLDVNWGVATVLRSQAFFELKNIGTRVAAPAEYAVGAIRALELTEPPVSTLVLAEWVRRMGQELFAPPNVAGWNGGRTWLTSRSVVARMNFAAALAEGELSPSGTFVDGQVLPRRYRVSDASAFYRQLLGLSAGDVPNQANDARINIAGYLASPAAMLN